MKNITRPPIRALGIILMLLWSLGLKAQTANNPVLTWDQEVGCIEYDDKGERDYVNLIEYIEAGACLRFCEGTTVNYSFTANNVQNVAWNAPGGTVQSSSNTGAAITWGASGSGAITLTITYTNNTVESLTICVEKIISPKAAFQIDGLDPWQKEFCTNMPISFDNLSTENNGTAIVNYLWDFGDGTTSSTFEPTHTYTTEGAYTVKLTVTNSCNCASVYEMDIYVKDAKAFEITCASITCENSRETYSVNDGCGGEWKVIGGDIVANNGTWIEVEWNQVDPSDGFGYVSYRSNCSCPFWTTVKIPVILRNAKIKGPEVVCQNAQGRYILPQWPTTEFEWMIDGDPNHPMLVKTEFRNEIVVDGSNPGTYTLSVRYRNTLIDFGKCEGYAEMKFSVEERPQIITDPELTICPNTSKTFSTHNGVAVQWQILLGGTVVHSAYSSSTNYNFPNPGSYIVTGDYNGCITDPVVVDVIAKPVLTGTISGTVNVCPNTPYVYTLSENEAGFIYVWSATGGTISGNNTGQQVTAIFTGSGSVSVVKQAVKNGKICSSDPVSFAVTQIVNNPVIINNSGLTQFCPSSTTTFSVSTPGFTPDHIEWSIASSTTGNTNFGSIINGINSATVTVGFNEISSSATGILTVKVTKCGKTETKTFTINLIPQPVLTLAPLAGICPGNTNITLNISSSVSLPSGQQIKVSFNGATPVGPYTVTGSGTNVSANIPNAFVNNTSGNVSQTITVYLQGLCNYSANASQTVTVYPLTKVSITPGYAFVVCPSSYAPITLNATVSTGITASTTFAWYKVGNPMSIGNLSSYSITGPNPGGEYYVEVSDLNTCLVQSQKVVVVENCGGSTGCTITPTPTITINGNWDPTNCTRINANVTYTGSPVITWQGSQHLTIDPLTINTPNAVFTTTVPGVHIATVYLNYNGCVVIRSVEIEKYYEPILKTAITCNANNTYNITLLNNSRIHGNVPITYTYAGPGVPANTTGQSFTVTNMAPGTYSYTLTLSSPGYPDCQVTIPVTLDPIPNPNFALTPLIYCADEAITLNVPGYNPAYEYWWGFNNTWYIANGPVTQIQFQDAGDYPIKLRIETPYGCSYESNNVTVKINKANFNPGTISPNPADFCVGSTVPLTYNPAGGTSTLSGLIWMKDNVQVGTGSSYLPTQSGSYWPVLVDGNGCKSYIMAGFARSYVLRQPPFASISGTTSLCYGDSGILYGITTDPSPALQHRWTGSGLPAGYNNWVSGNANMVLNLNSLTPGTYNYTFETRLTSDPTCTGSFTATVTVHPQVTAPSVSYSVYSCNPYTLQLTASGPTTGTYNWSNGATGQTIYVTHGGAYSVTYTETTGCSATGYIQAPHNPERALWIVPSGCYTVCKDSYLLGPLGMYQNYEWQINGTTSQSGGGMVPNQPIIAGGTYQLFLTQMGCTFGSNIPNIVPDIKNCPPNPCKFKVSFKLAETVQGGFMYYVTIVNPLSVPQAISLSSFYGYGTFSPATHILNPGTNTFMVYFYVNGTFTPGANDIFVITGTNCADTVTVQLGEVYWGKPAVVQAPTLEAAPNPAIETTVVSYTIGAEYQNAQSITVYDLTGIQRYQQKVNGTKGEVTFNVSHLAPGTYVISLQADGQLIATQKLIKK
ncbi:PKD domain-containing protein [Flavobacterium sp. xlx-214]|uniref:PKD domain-containing protein n=1 Tax=unclassified Flavobacterium TaxID=196869 RepID=UPI0013D37292|nr:MULTISPECIES: PKD domain-containing protein [unclassified Flavobacterium]MBA5793482.1 PKD domain-containing protein [Flavobacterium sp. xlx-221]QMI82747.1 PKD domain-containing protein [Flavobacterium sp. xlx-214]